MSGRSRLLALALALALSPGLGACVDLTRPPRSDAGVPPMPDAAEPDGGAPDVAREAGGDDAPADASDAPQDATDAPPATDARDAGPADVPPDVAVDTGADVPPSTLSMGLIAYWTLDSSAGAKALDSTANRNDAIVEGLPTVLGGTNNLPSLMFSNGGAFAFRGLDDAAWVGPADSLTPNRLSMAAWVRFESLNNRGKCGGASDALQYILFRRNPAASNGITDGVALIKQADQKLALVLQDGNGVRDVAASTTSAQPNRWIHVAATFDGNNGQMRIYVNGVAEGPGATHSQPLVFDPSGRLWIARSGECKDSGLGVSNFDGKLAGILDDVRIYGRVLSAREVSDLAMGRD